MLRQLYPLGLQIRLGKLLREFIALPYGFFDVKLVFTLGGVLDDGVNLLQDLFWRLLGWLFGWLFGRLVLFQDAPAEFLIVIED